MKNYAACSTNTKGNGDDQPHPLAYPERDALPGLTLLHFLWQGTALAALAGVLMVLCRRPSTRYVIAVSALVFMLAVPVVTFFVLESSGEPAPARSGVIAEPQPTNSVGIARISSALSHISPSIDAPSWLVQAWLLGVAFFSLRSVGGLLLLERERRKQSAALSARVLLICQTQQRRLGLDRAIRYCECQWLQTPAVIGWLRPVVLLPVTALTGLSEEQLQSVVAHELAHIQRFDAFVNVFQIVVETLLFYHPGVWWLNQRIRVEREHCCDDVAISLSGNAVEYARALTLMEEWRNAPALAMAANRGPLYERVVRVLGLKPVGAKNRRIGLAGGLLCLIAALVAGNAFLGIACPKPTFDNSPRSSLAAASATAQVAAPAPVAVPSRARLETVALKPIPGVKRRCSKKAVASSTVYNAADPASVRQKQTN